MKLILEKPYTQFKAGAEVDFPEGMAVTLIERKIARPADQSQQGKHRPAPPSTRHRPSPPATKQQGGGQTK